MKKMNRKLVWTLGTILGLIVLAVVGLRVFLPAEKVRDMAVAMAGDKLGREISVQDVGLSFAGGLGVDLAGVTVVNPPGFSGEPLLTAANIDLKLKLSPLLRGEFRVNRLVVDEPRLRLVRQENGNNNFTFADNESAAGNGPNDQADSEAVAISFDHLNIQGGHLDYFDEESGKKVELAGVDLAATLTNPQPGSFQSSGLLEVDSLLVAGDTPLPVMVGHLDYDLSLDTTVRKMELTRGDLVLNDLPLDLRGNLNSWPDSLRQHWEVKGEDLDLKDFLTFLTPEQKVHLETINFVAKVLGSVGVDYDSTTEPSLSYTGQATVTGLRAKKNDIEGELKAEAVLLGLKTDQLAVTSDSGTFASQPFVFNLTVEDFDDPRLKGSAAGNWDLAIAKPYLPAEKQAVLTGRCQFEGRFAGKMADAADIDYSGRAVLADLSYADKILPDKLEKLNGTVRFDPDSVVVEKATALFGGGDVTLTGNLVDHLPYYLPAEKDNRDALPKPTFTFSAHSSRIDVDRLFPAATPGASPPGDRTVVLDNLSTATIPDILGAGTIRADTLIYSRVPFTKVIGKIGLADRILECSDMTAGVYGGQVAGQVTVDLNDLKDPGYAGDFQADDIEANKFLSRFTNLKQVVSGKTGMSGSFAARGRDPERIKTTLTMDSLAALTSGKVVPGIFVNSALGKLAAGIGQDLAREQALRDLTTLIKVEDGRVGLEQFKTKLGSFGDLSLEGSYGFAGDLDYRGALLLTKDQTARLYANGGLVGDVAGLLGQKAERLSLPLTVNGTTTKPQMAFDFSELADNLKSQLQDDITEDLKDQLDEKLRGLFGK